MKMLSPKVNRKIQGGDLVIVYERHDQMKAITVHSGKNFQNRFGHFELSDWIGKPFGSKVFGIGSGSLTTSLARAVAPTGHVYTFDFHELRASSAREEFKRNGLSNLISVQVRDIQGQGFPQNICKEVDAVFLDLPQPWLALPSIAEVLRPDGVLCSFSPCIEQVQHTCEILKINKFTEIRTFEILLRTYDVREQSVNRLVEKTPSDNDCMPKHSQNKRARSEIENDGMCTIQETEAQTEKVRTVVARPCPESKGHTGYLTFTRRCL